MRQLTQNLRRNGPRIFGCFDQFFHRAAHQPNSRAPRRRTSTAIFNQNDRRALRAARSMMFCSVNGFFFSLIVISSAASKCGQREFQEAKSRTQTSSRKRPTENKRSHYRVSCSVFPVEVVSGMRAVWPLSCFSDWSDGNFLLVDEESVSHRWRQERDNLSCAVRNLPMNFVWMPRLPPCGCNIFVRVRDGVRDAFLISHAAPVSNAFFFSEIRSSMRLRAAPWSRSMIEVGTFIDVPCGPSKR